MTTTALERITKTEDRLDRLENIVHELAVSVIELKESQKQGFAELRESQKSLNNELGKLSRCLGTIVEDLVAPSLRRIYIESPHEPSRQSFC